MYTLEILYQHIHIIRIDLNVTVAIKKLIFNAAI